MIIAAVVSGIYALGTTWGLFSIPAAVNLVSSSDILLLLWYIFTIGSSGALFWGLALWPTKTV
jgi:hypothetical protein